MGTKNPTGPCGPTPRSGSTKGARGGLAANAGAAPAKANNPATPYTPEEFAEESYCCWQEGCSIVHIHAKDPATGYASADLTKIRPTIEAIRARAPELILNMSSAISPGPLMPALVKAA